MKSPSYYRGRIKLIESIIGSAKLSDKEYALLRNGYLDEQKFSKDIQKRAKEQSNKPLDFMELCRFSTWFSMHPEKIAGTEHIASSQMFPIKVKGTKQDVQRMFAKELKKGNKKGGKKESKNKESEAVALAIALQIELELMNL